MLSINVLDILHNDEALGMLPVEGNISILLSSEPDLRVAEDSIFLAKIENEQDIPNIGDSLFRSVGDNLIDQYDLIDIELAVSQNSIGWELVVDPAYPLIENSNYTILISKSLVPKYHTVSKEISLGNSAIGIETTSASSDSSDSFTLEITKSSSLSSGQHIIEYELRDGAGTLINSDSIDILNSNLTLNPSTSVSFKTNVPFLAGERFLIALQPFSSLGETRTQPFKTISSTHITESPEYNSTRLKEADILDFYETMGYSKRVDGNVETVATDKTIANAEFIYPNKFMIKTDVDIDAASLTSDAFEVSISEAFDNYLLSSLGLYSPNKTYTLSVSLKDTKTLLISVDENTSNINEVVIV